MRFTATELPGVWIIEPKVHKDARGFFMESYKAPLFAEQGVRVNFVQDNHARSEQQGVLRGMHFQTPPRAQAKLVRVIKGAVYDVVVDIRNGSPSYGKWVGVTLSAENHLQLFVPHGFAHGYLTLEPGCEVLYKVDDTYAPDHDAGLRWNDPEIDIDWPLDPAQFILSEKDQKLPLFKDFVSPFAFEES